MSDKKSKINSFLRLRHTGKLIGIINTAIYSALSYFGIMWLKKMIASDDGTQQSMGIILLFLSVGILVWGRDLITDTIDMQSPANKERDEHKKTKDKLERSQSDLSECRKIIHAIRSNITNTIMHEPTEEAKLKGITGIMMKINADLAVNNVSDFPKDNIQNDYILLFRSDNL